MIEDSFSSQQKKKVSKYLFFFPPTCNFPYKRRPYVVLPQVTLNHLVLFHAAMQISSLSLFFWCICVLAGCHDIQYLHIRIKIKINGGWSNIPKSKHILQQLNEEVQTLKKVEVDVICIAMKPNITQLYIYRISGWGGRDQWWRGSDVDRTPEDKKGDGSQLEGYDFNHSIGVLYKPLNGSPCGAGWNGRWYWKLQSGEGG